MYLKLETVIYIIVAVIMIYQAIRPRERNGGNFTPDTSSLANLFWGVLFLIFTLVYGGIFWW
jgi:hypothetical protein